MKNLLAVAAGTDFTRNGYWMNVQGLLTPAFFSNSLFAEGVDDIEVMFSHFLTVDLAVTTDGLLVSGFKVIEDEQKISDARHTLTWQNVCQLSTLLSMRGYALSSAEYTEETATYFCFFKRNGKVYSSKIRPDTSVLFLADLDFPA